MGLQLDLLRTIRMANRTFLTTLVVCSHPGLFCLKDYRIMRQNIRGHLLLATRYYSRISPPPPAYAKPVIRVSNNIAKLGSPKGGPKPRQLLSLPPFPGYPLPGKNQIGVSGESTHVTAISWVKHYFDEIQDSVIQSHFRKGLVSMNTYSSGS